MNIAIVFGLNILITLIWPDWYIEANNPGTLVWFASVFLSILLVFGVVFVAVNRLVMRLEDSQRLTILDHFRRCAFLYAAFALLGVLLLAFWDTDAGPEYGAALLIFLCSGYAILLDALVPLCGRRRLRNIGSRGLH